jgi:hypothetical protein
MANKDGQHHRDTRYLEQHQGLWRVVVGHRENGKVVKARRSLGTASLREAQRLRWAVVAAMKASPVTTHPINDPESWKAALAAGDGGPDDQTPLVLSDHLHTFNSGTGISEVTPKTTSIQLRVPDGKIQIGAYRTDAATAETLKAQAPEMFEDESVKQAREAAAAADAKAAEDATASLNVHPDAFVEESHTQFTNDVPVGLQVELLVQMHRDGAPSKDTLNRVADALGVPVDQAVTRLNAMSAGVQAQLGVLAKARGVNAEQFANWARDNRRGESLRAMQGHVQSRSLLSWDPLIAEFKARGQR